MVNVVQPGTPPISDVAVFVSALSAAPFALTTTPHTTNTTILAHSNTPDPDHDDDELTHRKKWRRSVAGNSKSALKQASWADSQNIESRLMINMGHPQAVADLNLDVDGVDRSHFGPESIANTRLRGQYLDRSNMTAFGVGRHVHAEMNQTSRCPPNHPSNSLLSSLFSLLFPLTSSYHLLPRLGSFLIWFTFFFSIFFSTFLL